MGLRGVHAAGGLGRVAARIGHLLQEDDILAGLGGIDRCGHAGAACADDHDIGIEFFILFVAGCLVLFGGEGL